MHLARIDIDWLPPLESIAFEFDERVNLFVGPNASGKSTILRSIKMLHSFATGEASPPIWYGDAGRITNVPANDESYGDLHLRYASINPDQSLIAMMASDDWPRDSTGVKWNALPFTYVPATRINLPAMDILGQMTEERPDAYLGTPPTQLIGIYSNVFSASQLEMLINWLRDKGDRRLRRSLQMALHLGYSCTKSICPEVITDYAPYPFVEEQIDGAFISEGTVRHDMGIGTSDSSVPGPLYAGALSSGTQGTLLWVWALAIKMANHYGWTEGWEKKPAILLIDEIENHLHPTWQRRVIPALLEHFPGLQIFATTHSPFVVAGLKAGQVHLLNRDQNGVVTATTNTEDVIGWTADEILRNMMGVDEPTDQLTVDRVNRLRQLRERETLTPEEESELNELRRQVNEDLLSKEGSLGAQRERYADLMEQFLRSRQSELSQDGD